MANIIETIFRADGRSFDTTLSRTEKRIEGFGRKSIATFTRIGQSIGNMSGRYMTGFSSLMGGAGLLYVGKGVVDLDSRIARLAITSGKSGREFMKFKSTIFEVAQATNQSADEVVDYFQTILEKTGNFDLAMQTANNAGIVATATGAQLAEIGSTVANIYEKMGITSDHTLEALDVLNMQAKAGSMEFSNFAGLMERLTAASGRFNLKGVEGVRVLGAWIQVAKKGSGSAEQATTAIEASIAEMLDPNNIKKMKKFGFNPIDTEATKKAGRTVMKDLDTMIKGIVTATKGDESKLGLIFGREAIRGLTEITRIYRDTGSFEGFDNFKKVGGNGAETMKDFAFFTEQTSQKVKALKTNLSDFANTNFAGPIEKLTNAIDYLTRHPAVVKGGLWALLGIGGVMFGAKMITSIKTLFDFMRGGGGKGLPGIAGGLGMSGAGGPVPVYIVNKHLSMLPGQGWGFPGGGQNMPVPGGSAPVGKFTKALTFAKWAGVGAASLTAGYEAGSWLDKVFGITEHGRIQNKIDAIESDKEWAREQYQKKLDVKNKIDITLTDNRTMVKTDNMNTETGITLNKGGAFK